MGTRKVTYVLEGDERDAVDAILKVGQKLRGADKDMKSFGSKKKQAFGTGDLTRFAGGLSKIRAALGVAGGTLAAGALFRGYQADVDKSVEKTSEFEKRITGFLSLGDNLKDIPGSKELVKNISTALDIGTDESSDFLFRLQSGAANLSKTLRDELMREALELKRVTGDDLPTSLQVLNKTLQIYEGELGSVNQAQNKLFRTAEQGDITFGDMASLLPDVLPAGKAMGRTLDELLAMIITATQIGGKSEKTFTGIRNVVLRMSEAEEKGIKLTGDLFDQLEQLSHVDGEAMKDIFGAEAISVAAGLAGKTDELRKNMEMLQGITVNDDFVSEKLIARLEDLDFLLASSVDSLQRGQENTLIGVGAKHGTLANEAELQKAGLREVLPASMGFLAKPAGTASAYIRDMIHSSMEAITGNDIEKNLTGAQSIAANQQLDTFLHAGQIDQYNATAGFLNREYANFDRSPIRTVGDPDAVAKHGGGDGPEQVKLLSEIARILEGMSTMSADAGNVSMPRRSVQAPAREVE